MLNDESARNTSHGQPDEERDWEEVRESWVGDRPSAPQHIEVEVPLRVIEAMPPPPPAPSPRSAPPAHSVPPPLPPPSVHPLPLEPPREELVQAMFERLAASDYEGAQRAAECVLRADHRSVDALQARELCRGELRKLYAARIGGLRAVPRIAVSASEVCALELDGRSQRVLTRVDGLSSVAAIAAAAGPVAEIDALRIVSELYLSGVLVIAVQDSSFAPPPRS